MLRGDDLTREQQGEFIDRLQSILYRRSIVGDDDEVRRFWDRAKEWNGDTFDAIGNLMDAFDLAPAKGSDTDDIEDQACD